MKRIVLSLVAMVFLCSCRSLSSQMPTQRVCFKEACFLVELAATKETRQQGLMYRKKLALDKGMLFVFDQPGEYGFWMKNTLLPLDMMWLDEEKRVVHIETNVPPCASDPCPIYSPLRPAKYVLELVAGRAMANGVIIGDILEW